MKDNIPQRVKASSAVDRGSAWQGSIAVAKLPRLAAAVAETRGALQAVLAAGRDDAGAARLSGTVDGELYLVCQHCMESFAWPLHLELELRLVSSEAEERRLLHDCEPYLVDGDSLPLQALIEEEVLLALPIAPRCGAC